MRRSHSRWALVAGLACVLIAADAVAHNPFLPPGRIGGPLDLGSDPLTTLRRRPPSTDEENGSRGDLEQVFILPQRPGKNKVQYYDFHWRRYDYLDRDGVGGVRLYFYDREVELARIAGALVRDQYEELVEKFDYRPTARVPYILYNSHREFQSTNVFFVTEHVLGVTSPQDLRMALPFWGEIERFREVSLHEMVHQFTIQKVADRAAAAGVESPLMMMPLWFIEGLAEFYSKGGIDSETEMFARDVLINSRPQRGYAMPDFWDDWRSFIYTYKLGQLRVAFLAETYGERVVQGILDQSPRMASGRAGGMGFGMGGGGGGENDAFKQLVARLTGEKPDAISQRFSAWLRRRILPSYLEAAQEPPAIAPVELPGEPDAFSSARDGRTVIFRSVERETGRSRLYLADRRDPTSSVRVAIDGQPGVESLHPVLRGVTAVREDKLAYLARDGSADALYVIPFERREKGAQVRFSLGRRQRIELAGSDIIEAGDPAFSPDGKRVAFFALDGVGRIDIWTAAVETGELRRHTHDLHAERDLAWSSEDPAVYGLTGGTGHQGTILFASDGTSDRRYNLYALDPRTGEAIRLTEESADHRHPYPVGEGKVIFATDAAGKEDLHELDVGENRMRRITDFVTALGSPAPGPRGLMAMGFFGGRYQIFDVPDDVFLSANERPARMDPSLQPAVSREPLFPFPNEPIPDDTPRYEPYARRNWRLENAVAAGGAGVVTMGQGALLFADVLGDRNLITQFAIFGSLELTDGMAFYIDRSGRQTWGGGLFHTFTQRRDFQAPGFDTDVLFLQREFGVTGLWSYPLNTFARVEGRLVAQGVQRTFWFGMDPMGFVEPFVPTAGLREWNASRGGMDLEGLASVRLGYDTTRFQFPGGAFGGGSVLLELGAGYLPLRQQPHAYSMLDSQYHLKLLGIAVAHLRLAGGYSAGSVFGRQFFLSSFDNLRNFQPLDRRLLGTMFVVGNADLEFPLDRIVRLAFITNVKAVLGLDVGSVATDSSLLLPNRSMAWVLGSNFGLGPFELRLHFARPIDIGGIQQANAWVPNVSLRYAYF